MGEPVTVTGVPVPPNGVGPEGAAVSRGGRRLRNTTVPYSFSTGFTVSRFFSMTCSACS